MFKYHLSKILPLFFSPLGLSFVLLIYSYFSKRSKITFLAILVLYFSSLGLVSNLIWSYLEKPWVRKKATKIEDSTAIVVLSSGRHPAPGKDKIIEWNDPDRFIAGIELHKLNPSNKLIFTGGINPYLKKLTPEGNIYKKEALKFGIPSESIFVTGNALNTFEEASQVKEILSKYGNINKKIILVTSAFHMYRAKYIFEMNNLNIIPFPVDFKTNAEWSGYKLFTLENIVPNINNLGMTSMGMREILGRYYYRKIDKKFLLN